MKRNILVVCIVLILCVVLVGCGAQAGNDFNMDEDALVVIAFSKWLESDRQANLLYNTNDCVYAGDIVGKGDDTITVRLRLYDRDVYTALESAGQDTHGAMLMDGVVTLSADDIH